MVINVFLFIYIRKGKFKAKKCMDDILAVEDR